MRMNKGEACSADTRAAGKYQDGTQQEVKAAKSRMIQCLGARQAVQLGMKHAQDLPPPASVER